MRQMDGASHAAWGYLIWYDSPYTWLAVLCCVLPDIISMGPPAIASGVRHQSLRAIFLERDPPAWALRYKKVTFPVAHSLLVSMGVWAVVALVWSPQWWLLGWPLHVFIDIFTHPREKATPYLWPLKTRLVHGVRWWGRPFLIANTVALIIVSSFVLF